MKKILLPALLSLVISQADAQATLEHVYAPCRGSSQVILFSSNGEKIMDHDSFAVHLYNMNHTLWKTIPLPVISGYTPGNIYLVSDNLFNTDNAVELVVTYSSNSLYPQYKAQLLNESGSVVQTIDTSSFVAAHYNEVDDNYKLFTSVASIVSITPVSVTLTNKVFSVPGTLPCGKCGTMGTEKVSGTAGVQIGVADPRPNPSAGITRIDYLLPVGINDAQLVVYNAGGTIAQMHALAPQATFVYLDNSSFAPGVYTYVIRSGAASSEVKKMVVK